MTRDLPSRLARTAISGRNGENALAASCSTTSRSQLLRVHTAYHSSFGKASPPWFAAIGPQTRRFVQLVVVGYFPLGPAPSWATCPCALTAFPVPSVPPKIDCAECPLGDPLHHRVWSTTVSCGPRTMFKPVRLFASFPSNKSIRVVKVTLPPAVSCSTVS